MISQIHLSASTQPASTQVAEVLKTKKKILSGLLRTLPTFQENLFQ